MVQLFHLKRLPAGYAAKEGDFYTYAIWDLTKFNERYGTKYYASAYKRFDDSTDTTVELLDKNTGSVVETRTITASSGVQKFTTTTAASNSQLTFQVDYKAGTAQVVKSRTIYSKWLCSWKEYHRLSSWWAPTYACRASTLYCGL